VTFIVKVVQGLDIATTVEVSTLELSGDKSERDRERGRSREGWDWVRNGVGTGVGVVLYHTN
jgi:hypothetical protein